ncbi:MAG: FlgD immunoglobulin-like domain containing protein [Paludibacter sp.]|nr:FlgD immunoglobulin-like domain containing protein [Paludibacter sp.]
MTGYDPSYLVPADITSIKKIAEQINIGVMSQNYPNPFIVNTNIEFQLPADQKIRVVIYDLNGRTVRNLADRMFYSGKNTLIWDGTDDSGNRLNSGLYFYVLLNNNLKVGNKMIFTR